MGKKKRLKKMGPVGGFGVRYGATTRKRYIEVVTKSRDRYTCPQCNTENVKRESVGIWICEKCGSRFTGGAYTPFTKLGVTADRVSRTK
ncbi:MAG: 50S ribosomal protein L37ae [Nitrososphaerota archaeon]|nr:50S ribosomal protein L37ae [Candidatus Bathyarchaeota archaeon]MDW8048816.1 50S ribosomal protein L37ae [Nitrososphaerota archaeon]